MNIIASIKGEFKWLDLLIVEGGLTLLLNKVEMFVHVTICGMNVLSTS